MLFYIEAKISQIFFEKFNILVNIYKIVNAFSLRSVSV
jgi:hypothetical protein